MADLFTPQFLMSVLAIILINILLSGDNAVVIAPACPNPPDNLLPTGTPGAGHRPIVRA